MTEESSTKLLVQVLDNRAKIPTVGTDQSAGFDLYAIEDILIQPRSQVLARTGLALQPPAGTYLRLASRSGLALRASVHVEAGVVDPDYRGEVKIILHNSSCISHQVVKHDRIAQIICEKIDRPVIEIVEQLTLSDRGVKGFGSTGQ